jgi:hypothetical protein
MLLFEERVAGASVCPGGVAIADAVPERVESAQGQALGQAPGRWGAV